MKKKEISKILKRLNNCPAISDMKIIYAMEKNKRLLADEAEILDKLKKSTDNIKAYDTERFALCKKYCKKDATGLEVISNGYFMFEDSQKEEYNTEFQKLLKKHKNAIEDIERLEKEYEELMDTESDVKLLKIDFESLPALNKEQMGCLLDMINYTEG